MQTRRQFLASAAAVGLLGRRGVDAQGPQPATIPGVDVGEVTKSFALRNVTVIDCTGKPAQPGMTVVVAGNRIRSIEPAARARLTPDVQTVNGNDKFLIPGLWDMHVHPNAANFPLFIPNGITGIRTMGGLRLRQLESQLSLRNEIAAGKRLGPRMVVPVRLVGSDGLGIGKLAPENRFPNTEFVEGPDEAHSAVRAAVKMGADFIKVHRGHSRDTFLAIADEANRQNIRFAGHVQFAVPRPDMLRQACEAGIASIEHVEHLRAYINNELGGPDLIGMDGLSPSQAAAMQELLATFRRNNTWFCPAHTDTPRAVPIVSTDPRLRYFDSTQRKIWSERFVIPLAQTERTQRAYRNVLSFTAALHKANVEILAGSDSGGELGMIGFWLHEELAQLVAAGLSSMDALRSATYKPAEFLGLLDSLGTIQSGRSAEMVLLDANPLDDITNTTKINMVFTGGRVYRRPALDAILTAVEANARN